MSKLTKEMVVQPSQKDGKSMFDPEPYTVSMDAVGGTIGSGESKGR